MALGLRGTSIKLSVISFVFKAICLDVHIISCLESIEGTMLDVSGSQVVNRLEVFGILKLFCQNFVNF